MAYAKVGTCCCGCIITDEKFSRDPGDLFDLFWDSGNSQGTWDTDGSEQLKLTTPHGTISRLDHVVPTWGTSRIGKRMTVDVVSDTGGDQIGLFHTGLAYLLEIGNPGKLLIVSSATAAIIWECDGLNFAKNVTHTLELCGDDTTADNSAMVVTVDGERIVGIAEGDIESEHNYGIASVASVGETRWDNFLLEQIGGTLGSQTCPRCQDCVWTIGDNEQVRVVLTGFTDNAGNNCSTCTTFNGTYILEQVNEASVPATVVTEAEATCGVVGGGPPISVCQWYALTGISVNCGRSGDATTTLALYVWACASVGSLGALSLIFWDEGGDGLYFTPGFDAFTGIAGTDCDPVTTHDLSFDFNSCHLDTLNGFTVEAI